MSQNEQNQGDNTQNAGNSQESGNSELQAAGTGQAAARLFQRVIDGHSERMRALGLSE